MIWVSWRQHRSQAIACLGVLAALAVYAILLGTTMRTAFGQDGLITCLARSQGTGCRAAIQAFMDRFGSEVNVAFWSVLLILPGLIGVLVGGPLIARELEYGTWRLAWSQTRSPGPVAGRQAGSGHRRAHRLRRGDDRGDHLVPRADGPAHRPFPAQRLRLRGPGPDRLHPVRVRLRRAGRAAVAPQYPGHGGRVHPMAGHPARGRVPAPPPLPGAPDVLQVCPQTDRVRRLRPGLPAPGNRPHRGLGAGQGGGQLANQSVNTYLYQPADRFWTFQFIEAGIFVLLTAAALGATIWLLHRRAA